MLQARDKKDFENVSKAHIPPLFDIRALGVYILGYFDVYKQKDAKKYCVFDYAGSQQHIY